MTPYLPPGFQFHPSHLELVLYYLLKKVLGDKLPSDAVIEGEVYGDEARLPEAHDIGNRELHRFVKIKKNQNGTKTKRKTKNGYWKVTGNKKKINDESGNHIGTMRSLVFVEKCNSEGEKKLIMDERKKNLLMDEYTLDGSLKEINSEGWVLCKIKQSIRSPERPNSQEEEEEEEEGDGLTSTPTASPALQGIDNRSSNLVMDGMDCVDTDDFWASMEDNRGMAECPSETAGGPSHLLPDQSWTVMETPTLKPIETPALDDFWENYNRAMAECPFETARGASHLLPDQSFDLSWTVMETPTLKPIETPALDDFWENYNRAMAECPSETAGGPSHLLPDQSFDQSWTVMETPTLKPIETPALDDFWENFNWENIYTECSDNRRD